MNWNPNSRKHKANHRGYKSKPTKQQAMATFNFFDLRGVEIPAPIAPGTQLKLEL